MRPPKRPDLFVGMTTWQSELMLPTALSALRRHTDGATTRLVVIDNMSTDASCTIARDHGAEVIRMRCGQAEALERLVNLSRGKYTLLLHADVVLLAPDWLETCTAKLADGTVLVSPQDIGCGPWTRPYGRGKPESSFMLWDTAAMRRLRRWSRTRWHRLPAPTLRLRFDGAHITHHLPGVLQEAGLSWAPMEVLCSEPLQQPWFDPGNLPCLWSPSMGKLRYGLGNFYRLDGRVTHYHNWFDRIERHGGKSRGGTTTGDGSGVPIDYIAAATQRFLEDWRADRVHLPPAAAREQAPAELTANVSAAP
ncbi:MAG: glycosyltransferase family 2 protein [Planctomycetota bacterium]